LATDKYASAQLLHACLPDLVCMVDRVEWQSDTIAVLWRIAGHHTVDGFDMPATGRRLRIIGSSIFTMAAGRVVCDMTVTDNIATRAQLYQAIFDL
jgi:predicted ester cyclase